MPLVIPHSYLIETRNSKPDQANTRNKQTLPMTCLLLMKASNPQTDAAPSNGKTYLASTDLAERLL